MGMKKILVLFGGESPEYEVALQSAAYIYRSLQATKAYRLILCGIKKDGTFYHYTGPIEKLENNTWWADEKDLAEVFWPLSEPGKGPGYYVLNKDKEGSRPGSLDSRVDFDLVFPVLHGSNGEDGRLQGFLELCHVPFVGCATLASAVSMDKLQTKINAAHLKVPQLPYVVLEACDFAKDPMSCVLDIEDALSYPCFIKPANGGSSLGISKAHNREEAKKALKEAFTYDHKVLVEEDGAGREVELAVLGNTRTGVILVSLPGEIKVHADFYDYQSKYVDDVCTFHVPADLPHGVVDKLQDYAQQIFQQNDGDGLARVDFFYREDREPNIVFNEINTMPGFTQISMYPKMMANLGLDGPTLCQKLVELGFERYDDGNHYQAQRQH